MSKIGEVQTNSKYRAVLVSSLMGLAVMLSIASGSDSGTSYRDSDSDVQSCNPDVERAAYAVAVRGGSDLEMFRAGEAAMDRCMCRKGYTAGC